MRLCLARGFGSDKAAPRPCNGRRQHRRDCNVVRHLRRCVNHADMWPIELVLVRLDRPCPDSHDTHLNQTELTRRGLRGVSTISKLTMISGFHQKHRDKPPVEFPAHCQGEMASETDSAWRRGHRTINKSSAFERRCLPKPVGGTGKKRGLLRIHWLHWAVLGTLSTLQWWIGPIKRVVECLCIGCRGTYL